MFKTLITALIFALMLSGLATAQKPVAQLPRVYIDTTWNPPVGGTTWEAHTALQLCSALNVAVPGDTIVLDAGVTYSGNFHIPSKANPNHKWIYMVSSAYSKLPTPGTRVSPANAANMPKIVTPGATGVLGFMDGANYWRLAGIEIASASTCRPPNYTAGVYYGYSLIGPYNGSPKILPDHIVFDRVYVHGDATHDVQSGIQGNFSSVAIIDSYISDIHMLGTDTQVLLFFYTPGPIKVTNNYISAAAENMMLGGAGGSANPYVPSDVEIRGNYFYKPLSWMAVGVSIPPNATMVVKNAFEIKNGQRVLFDSNVVENVWAAGQGGAAILFTIRTSQSGNNAVVHDITMTNNILKNVLSGWAILAIDYMCAVAPYTSCTNAGDTARLDIVNNLVTYMDPTLPWNAPWGNEALSINQSKDMTKGGAPGFTHDVLFQHNTFVMPPAGVPKWGAYFSVSATQTKPPFAPGAISNNIWILDNVMIRQPTGDWGVTPFLTQYMAAPTTPPYDQTQRFYGNVIYAPPGEKVPTSWPAHNYVTTVPFTFDANSKLVTPYWTDTSDGRLAGVNSANLPTSTGSSLVRVLVPVSGSQ